jgi:hypothetical protein
MRPLRRRIIANLTVRTHETAHILYNSQYWDLDCLAKVKLLAYVRNGNSLYDTSMSNCIACQVYRKLYEQIRNLWRGYEHGPVGIRFFQVLCDGNVLVGCT